MWSVVAEAVGGHRDGVEGLELAADDLGHGGEVAHMAGEVVVADAAADAGGFEGEGEEGGDRGRERLRAGDAPFESGVGVDGAVGDAGGLAAGGVADRDLGGAAGARDVHGFQHVHRLARLANRNDKCLGAEHGLAVAELAGVVGIGGKAGDLFEVPASDHGGVQARAHPHEEDALDALEPGAGLAEVVEGEAGGLDRHEAADGVGEGGGLLHDLLEHVGLVGTRAALAGSRETVRGSTSAAVPSRVA